MLIRAFAIFQLSLELFHSVPGVPYLFVLLYLDSFFIDSSSSSIFIDHTPLCINEHESSHKRFRWCSEIIVFVKFYSPNINNKKKIYLY